MEVHGHSHVHSRHSAVASVHRLKQLGILLRLSVNLIVSLVRLGYLRVVGCGVLHGGVPHRGVVHGRVARNRSPRPWGMKSMSSSFNDQDPMISPDGSIEGGEESMLLFFRSFKWSSHELCLLRSTCAVLAALVANLLEEGMRVVTRKWVRETNKCHP